MEDKNKNEEEENKTKLKLILTGDDFLYNQQRDDAMLDLLERDCLTRLSVLVNSVNKPPNKLKTFDKLGLHFNITEGLPISCKEDICSLMNKKSRAFYDKVSFYKLCRACRIDLAHVEKELISQIEEFKCLFFSYPAYVDGHQHIHVFPGVRKTFVKVLKQYGIKETRLPLEMEVEPGCLCLCGYYKNVVKEAEKARLLFIKEKISFPDYFLGIQVMSEMMNEETIKKAILKIIKENCEPKTLEIMTHPGFKPVNDKGGCGVEMDCFSQSHLRIHEYLVLSSSTLMQFYAENNIKLISFLHKGKCPQASK